jgi:hypothetical protein
MTHHLKTWPPFFEEVDQGKKNFELRKNDRNFQLGDILVLQEWTADTEQYTGRAITKKVEYILEGGSLGLERGYVIMALSDVE